MTGPAPVRRTPRIHDILAGWLVASAVALTALHWKSIFADLGFVAPVLLVTVAVAAAVVISTTIGWSRPASFGLATAVTIIVLGTRYQTSLADLPGDLISSWKALASTGLLIATEPRFVLVPVLVAALGTWLGTEVLVRNRLGAPALLAVLASHATALAYTVSQQQPTWWLVGLLGLLGGLLLALGGLARPGGSEYARGEFSIGPRQMASVGVVAAVLGLVAGGLTVVLTPGAEADDRAAFDLRSHLRRPLDITESATPLARVKAGLVDTEDATVFTITVDGLGPDDSIDLLPVAVLDRYDGTIWSTTARFEVAGASLPAPLQPMPTGTSVSVLVDLTARYPFRFLPQAGRLQTIVEGDLAWDPSTGTTAALDPDANRYRARAAIFTTPALPSALDTAGAVGVTQQRSELTDAQRDVLNRYLAEITSADDDAITQLQAINDDLLSDRFGYNIDAPAGHSLAAITSYLEPGPADAGAPPPRVGFSEHSASAFATLARELGVPSRVVVGYLLPDPLTADRPQVTVSDTMIHAWPEVFLNDVGWVRFDPTNKQNQTLDQPTRAPAVSAAGVEANATDLPDLEEPVLLGDEEPVTDASSLWWLLALALVPVSYVVVVVAAKRLRRARRKARSADGRVVGAWRETQDRLRELGLPARDSLSALDTAEELDLIDLRQVGDPIVTLAPTLDTALYAPHSTTDTEADEAWVSAAAAIKLARQASGPTQRIKAALDPRAVARR